LNIRANATGHFSETGLPDGGTHPEDRDLSRRRDRILKAPEMDLEALSALAADYEAAIMPCTAADIRRRLEYYWEKKRLVNSSTTGVGEIMGNQAGCEGALKRRYRRVQVGMYFEQGVETGNIQNVCHGRLRGKQFHVFLEPAVTIPVNGMVGCPA
jgi:hypothetical protein